jgi:hypothetical protein
MVAQSAERSGHGVSTVRTYAPGLPVYERTVAV